MTRDEFLRMLKQHNINVKIVSFDDSLCDGYCVRKNYLRWEVLIRERGKEYNVVGFPSESDALRSLYEKLLRIYG